MMGEGRVGQDALFYEFSLERHVPSEHLLRSIDRFVDLTGVRCDLAPFYSEMGRPSIDPELMIQMLVVGYCFAIRSERRLCEIRVWVDPEGRKCSKTVINTFYVADSRFHDRGSPKALVEERWSCAFPSW